MRTKSKSGDSAGWPGMQRYGDGMKRILTRGWRQRQAQSRNPGRISEMHGVKVSNAFTGRPNLFAIQSLCILLVYGSGLSSLSSLCICYIVLCFLALSFCHCTSIAAQPTTSSFNSIPYSSFSVFNNGSHKSQLIGAKMPFSLITPSKICKTATAHGVPTKRAMLE